MEHTLTWCGFTLTVAAHSVRGESTTEATGQHELGGVQSSDGGQPHGAAQGPRRLPVLLSQSGNLQFTLKNLHFMFKLCQVVVILDRRKGDRDVLLSNRLAICRCFLHDECIKAFVVSVLSKWQNYIRPSYFYVVIYKKKICADTLICWCIVFL